MVSGQEWGEGVESAESGSLWAVVLAGGEGTRLHPLVRHLCGDERPNQFSPLLGTRTLLRQTLDRVGFLIPLERTVVVTLQAHARYLERELGERPRPHVLNQPESRGTAAGILLAAQWIEARRIVLLGAPPSQPETDYGWIEPGERVGWTSQGPVHAIRRFREKPSKEVAAALWLEGSPWNTFVFAARAAMLLSAGRECAPALYDRLAPLRRSPVVSPSGGRCARPTPWRPPWISRGPFSRHARRCSRCRNCRG
jgi:mannose-1-phosphate guanylyltransferase